MSITNIISAIGNNNSRYPLLVRDCGIEVPTKIYLTYKQNESDKTVARLATRERIVDEYTVSAVWLGGISVLGKMCGWLFKKKGFNPNISSKLLNETSLQGIELNINKFKNLAPEAVKELEFLNNNKAQYKKLVAGRFFAETLIPITLMGFVIPKLIFAWTAKTKEKIAKQKEIINQRFLSTKFKTMENFAATKEAIDDNTKSTNKTVTFKGNVLADIADMSTVKKMAVTDGGYAVGRIITARNKDAAVDVGFKMAGMMFLNFVFPNMLAKALDTTTGKALNTKLDLDIKLFNDKAFINEIKENKFILPEFKTEKDVLEFVDKNPKNIFVQYAKKYNMVKFLKNDVRDPRYYVEVEKLKLFWENLADFSQKAIESKDITKFIKKAKIIKGANILANVGISSFLLSYALPKTQFAFRKLILKKELEPGIAD